jgi:putative membrane protein
MPSHSPLSTAPAHSRRAPWPRTARRALRARAVVAAFGIAIALLAAPAVTAAHGAGQIGVTDAASMLTAWSFPPLVVIGIVASAVLYLSLVRRVDAAHPDYRWPRRRTAFVLLGLASVALALLSPIDTFSDEALSIHMVQHLLLTSVGPPFLVAAGFGTLILRAADGGTRDRVLLPLLHSRLVTWITFPPLGWAAFLAVMWGTHFSGLYNIAIEDETVHILEHLAYLAASMLFWLPVFGPDPSRWRMKPGLGAIYVLAQMPQMSFISVALMGANRVMYPAYASAVNPFGLDPVSDQQLAGGEMWVLGNLAFMAALVVIGRTFIIQEEAESVRVDARLDREQRLAITALHHAGTHGGNGRTDRLPDGRRSFTVGPDDGDGDWMSRPDPGRDG